jgi:hypothetical protein
MTSANRRRTTPSPVQLENARLRARGREAIAKIITIEAKLEDLNTPELRFTVGLLEWMAGFPVEGADG